MLLVWARLQLGLSKENLLALYILTPSAWRQGCWWSKNCPSTAFRVYCIPTSRGVWDLLPVLLKNFHFHLFGGLPVVFPTVSTRPWLPCWSECGSCFYRWEYRLSGWLCHIPALPCIDECSKIKYTYNTGVGIAEGIIEFIFQQLPVHFPISVHSINHLLVCFRPLVHDGCDNVFGWQVHSSARREAVISIQELGNNCSTDDCGAHGCW